MVADHTQLGLAVKEMAPVSRRQAEQAPVTNPTPGIRAVALVPGEQVVVVGPAGCAVLAADLAPLLAALKQNDGLARRQLGDDGVVAGGAFTQAQGDVSDLQPGGFDILGLGSADDEEQEQEDCWQSGAHRASLQTR